MLRAVEFGRGGGPVTYVDGTVGGCRHARRRERSQRPVAAGRARIERRPTAVLRAGVAGLHPDVARV